MRLSALLESTYLPTAGIHSKSQNKQRCPLDHHYIASQHLVNFVKVSLFILLFGTIVGDFALLGDVGNQAMHSLWDTPPAFIDPNGRLVMVHSAA